MGEPAVAAPVAQPYTPPPPAIEPPVPQVPVTQPSPPAPDGSAAKMELDRISTKGGSAANIKPEIKVETRSLGQGLSTSDPQFKPVGTLNVGDAFASTAQNSKTTANAANDKTPSHASLDVSVAPPQPSPSTQPVRQSPTQDSVETQTIPLYSMSHYQASYLNEVPTYSYVRETAHSYEEVQPARVSHEESSPPASARYRLNVFDVHDMGGTKSAIHIKTKEGQLLRRVELKPGNSEMDVDLPPGDYSFEAISGQRKADSANPKKDDKDNFRVEVSKK